MITSLLVAVILSQTPAAEPAAAAQPAAVQPAPAPAPEKKPEAAKPAFPKFTVWGFIDAQWSRLDPPAPTKPTSTFELRRARIGVKGDVTPYTGFNILWDGADTALKDAYANLKNVPGLPGLELRFGQWKTPFGYEQPESDTKLLWVNSSYVVNFLARATTVATASTASDSRDAGLGVIGAWDVGPVKAELNASFVNGVGPNKKDDLEQKNLWARGGASTKVGPATVRAGLSIGNGQQVVATGANAKFDGIGTRVDDTYQWFLTYGGDVEVDTPWFFCAAEWIRSEKDQQAFTTTGTGTAAVLAEKRSSFNADGWYAGIFGKTPWGAGPILRVEQYDRNEHVKGNFNRRTTVGAYYDIVAPVSSRIIFNYELDHSDKSVKTGDKAYVFVQMMF
ncbi:MAG: porin [Anaeromyxobacter sp.]